MCEPAAGDDTIAMTNLGATKLDFDAGAGADSAVLSGVSAIDSIMAHLGEGDDTFEHRGLVHQKPATVRRRAASTRCPKKPTRSSAHERNPVGSISTAYPNYSKLAPSCPVKRPLRNGL